MPHFLVLPMWGSACLDRLTCRLGHLDGAAEKPPFDYEAFDVGAAAIEDRWSIIIDALQAGFAAELRDAWDDLDWEPPLGDYDPMDEPDNHITMAVYQCGDDLSAAPDYYDEAWTKGKWLRLGREAQERAAIGRAVLPPTDECSYPATEISGERIQIDTPADGEGGAAPVSLSPEREETKMQIEKGM